MHNALVEVLRKGISALGYTTQPGEVWEPSFAEEDKNGNIRAKKLDVRIEDFKGGPAYIDPTIAHVACQRACNYQSVQAYMDFKKRQKKDTYATRDASHRLKTTLQFYPFAVTAFGSWDADAVKVVRELAHAKKLPPADIFDSVSIVLARSVARNLRRSMGPLRIVKGSQAKDRNSRPVYRLSVEPSQRVGRGSGASVSPVYPEQTELAGFPAAAPEKTPVPAEERAARAKAALQRSAAYQKANWIHMRPGFSSQEERARLQSRQQLTRRPVAPETVPSAVQTRVAELDSRSARPLAPQSHRGAGAVWDEVGEEISVLRPAAGNPGVAESRWLPTAPGAAIAPGMDAAPAWQTRPIWSGLCEKSNSHKPDQDQRSDSAEGEYVEMDPYVRKGKGRARRAQAIAAGARKGPPAAGGGAPRVNVCNSKAASVVFTAPPAGVVGEGIRRSTAEPRITVCQGLCDELEFSDWKYYQSLTLSNAISNVHSQPEFSFFSVARDAGH